MKKVATKTKLRKRCIELAKKIVRHQSGYKCEYCKQGEPLKRTHGCHIYGEGTYPNMSADLDNIICLCYTHHLGWSKNNKNPSWHNNPMEMTEWFREKYPFRAEALRNIAKMNYKVNWEMKLGELKSIYIELIN